MDVPRPACLLFCLAKKWLKRKKMRRNLGFSCLLATDFTFWIWLRLGWKGWGRVGLGFLQHQLWSVSSHTHKLLWLSGGSFFEDQLDFGCFWICILLGLCILALVKHHHSPPLDKLLHSVTFRSQTHIRDASSKSKTNPFIGHTKRANRKHADGGKTGNTKNARKSRSSQTGFAVECPRTSYRWPLRK